MTRLPAPAAGAASWRRALVVPVVVLALLRAPAGLADEEPTRPWLGVTVLALETEDGGSPMNGALARDGRAPTTALHGLRVTRVIPGSPAERAGLRPGDVVVSAGGRPLDDVRDLAGRIARRTAGDALVLSVRRDGALRTVTARLAEPPQAGEASRRVVGRIVGEDEVPFLSFAGDTLRADLGLEIMELTPGLRRYFEVGPDEGVLVQTVAQGSPAGDAGLRAGDLLLSIDRRPVNDGAQLAAALRALRPGQAVDLGFVRSGRRGSASATALVRTVPVWVLEHRSPAVTSARTLRLDATGPDVDEAELARLRLELEKLLRQVRDLQRSPSAPKDAD